VFMRLALRSWFGTSLVPCQSLFFQLDGYSLIGMDSGHRAVPQVHKIHAGTSIQFRCKLERRYPSPVPSPGPALAMARRPFSVLSRRGAAGEKESLDPDGAGSLDVEVFDCLRDECQIEALWWRCWL
jgi:hypothetical protein